MTVNVGRLDRVFRAILGVVLLVLPFVSGMAIFETGIATAVSVIVGVVMLATSSMRFCPLYRILGIQTCKL
jgi:hypothetical protein